MILPFFSRLEEIFLVIEKILGKVACSDYVKKLICKSNNSFDEYQYNSSFTELLVLHLILTTWGEKIISAKYEPPSKTNNKKTEYKFTIHDAVLNVEVKALNSANIFNRNRNNREILDLISVFGDQVFEEDENFPRWDLYKILVLQQKQYVIVPYWKDDKEVFKEVITFLTPKDKLTEEVLQCIEQIKLTTRYEPSTRKIYKS